MQENDRYEWLKQNHLVRTLEAVQDLIVVSLCIGLFSFMLIQLREMFLSLLPPLDFPAVTADILFLLILVELFRLMVIYLQEHRVSIGVAVEVSIVSILREVIVRGVLEAPSSQILSACALLLVLGALLVVRVWLPPTFEGIDPEHLISVRRQRELSHPQATSLPNLAASHLAASNLTESNLAASNLAASPAASAISAPNLTVLDLNGAASKRVDSLS